MNKIIEHNIEEIHRLCEKYMVESLFLFGSANTRKFSEKSDIDLLISFKNTVSLLDYADNYFDLEESLKDLLKRQIDLVVEKSVRNPYFKEEIEETKIKIYGA